jgi:hypothetical protein
VIVFPHCQREQLVAEHTLLQLLHGRTNGGLGIRPAVRRLVHRDHREPPRLGAPSRYAVGDWVRVLDPSLLRATLDARGKTRGLLFSRQQWSYCGHAARVSKIVRRIVDDLGHMRAVSRTGLLESVDCDGVDGLQGCGRLCPLLFRDEWLEPATTPAAIAPHPSRGFATIRPLAEIRATLDWRGRRGGLMFMPEQARFAGQRFRVLRKLDRVIEADREDAIVREPIYVLETPRCTGGILGDRGPCDRGCGLLWHGDWLVLDGRPAA